MKSGAYEIRCKATGHSYVGASKRLTRRIAEHKKQLRNGIHRIKEMQSAWRLYGEEGFDFNILALASPEDDLVELEQRFLNELQPFKPFGYNTHKTAIPARRNKPLPPEEAARWSKAFAGRRHSEESRERIRAAKLRLDNPVRGRKWTAEQRANTVRHSGEAHHYFGKQRTLEVRLAISRKNAAAIVQTDESGAVVRVWPSTFEAALTLGFNKATLGGAVRRQGKYANYWWRYQDPERVKRRVAL